VTAGPIALIAMLKNLVSQKKVSGGMAGGGFEGMINWGKILRSRVKEILKIGNFEIGFLKIINPIPGLHNPAQIKAQPIG
jgi:hypothetical protein